MAFVKDVRLRRAREMLNDAEPGATVTAVAYRCGYQNHGYFAREYRARFGESPSTTLARSRRAPPARPANSNCSANARVSPSVRFRD